MRKIESCTLLDLRKPLDNAPCKGLPLQRNGIKDTHWSTKHEALVTLFCNILRDFILPESVDKPFTAQKPFLVRNLLSFIYDQDRFVLLYEQQTNYKFTAKLLSKKRKRVKTTKRNNKSQTGINKLFTKQKGNNARPKVTI